MVAVAGLTDSLDQGIRSEARQLLAADLAIESRRPAPPEIEPVLARWPGLARTTTTEMVTVVAASGDGGAPGRSQLVEVKAVGAEYPFYGTLALAPARPLAELLADGAVVAPDLLSRLGLRVGDVLQLGGVGFPIRGVVRGEPDRLTGAFSLGPRVFVSRAGLERTGLVATGSRVEHRLLLRLPPGTPPEAADRLADELRAALPVGPYDVESYREAQPSLREGLQRVERFLGLVALLSLVVGGVGVAGTVRAWLAARLDAVAVLKTLGMRPREVFGLYLAQAAALGLLGSLGGALVGLAIQRLVPALLGDLLPARLVALWQPFAALRGIALGTGVALLFSLPPLATVLRVPAARVLRRTAEPLPPHRLARLLAALGTFAGVLLVARAQSGSWLRAAQFSAGLAAAAALLALAGWLLARGLGRLPRARVGVALRHGLASLARPGSGAVGAVVALGVGVLVVLAMAVVESHLGHELETGVPADAPTAFLVDIQPDQWAGVEEILRAEGADRVDSVPVVMARLMRIDGTSTDELARRTPRGDDRRWALTREQRLTYLDRLPPDNRVVASIASAADLPHSLAPATAGAEKVGPQGRVLSNGPEGRALSNGLWVDPARAEVSVEREFAGELGVELGSILHFDIQGVPLELLVTSVREVDWRTFGINFFLVVEPGVLEDAPQQRLAVARLQRGGEQRVQDLLAARFPNVTLLQTREILERIRGVLLRLGAGVRVLGSFTVAAGLVILAGAVAAGAARRGREVALLKTLGMTRLGVVLALAVEHALVGLVAAIVGVAGGAVLGREVVRRGLELDWQPQPALYLAFVAGTMLLAGAAGTLASAGALRRRPIDVLRHEDA